MKKILMITVVFLSFSLFVGTQAIAAGGSALQGEEKPIIDDVTILQQEWAHIKYRMEDEDQQNEAMKALSARAAAVSAKYPENAEVKIWEGIIVSTEAGMGEWYSALSKVKRARALFEESIKIDPSALDGAAYTSLGSLYYQVPGWPVGFGDDEKAEDFLKKGLEVDPDGIDSNYFYGDFLLQDRRYKKARIYLEKALQAKARPQRPVADAGRRGEIAAALAQIE